MSGYRLTPEADNDLVDIWLHGSEKWGVKQANDYLTQLEKCFEKLAKFPGMGRPRNEIRQGYRSFHEACHLVFYRQYNNELQIIRVLHQHMDVKTNL